MNIPSDFDPLAWGERRYIQPILKGQGGNIYANWGVTDESYPHSFKMEAGRKDGNDNRLWKAFDGDSATYWGNYTQEYWYGLMYFEKPLRIVGMGMTIFNGAYAPLSYKLYGVPEGEDPATEGTLLGELSLPSHPQPQQSLDTANRSHYRQYRVDVHSSRTHSAWVNVYDIKLDAYYRPADL